MQVHAQDKVFEATLPRGSRRMDRFEKDMILYRPAGLQELALIYDSGMKAFPARLPQQPIFYPVLQLDLARQTAFNCNAKTHDIDESLTLCARSHLSWYGEVAKLVHHAKHIRVVPLFYNPAVYNTIDIYVGNGCFLLCRRNSPKWVLRFEPNGLAVYHQVALRDE